MVYLEAKDGWHRHPSRSRAHRTRIVVRVTVKALGDYTSRLQELVEPGMPAVIGGPARPLQPLEGNRRRSGSPAASASRRSSAGCARSTATCRHRVDFFYSSDGEPPFADEIRAIADRHDSLHAHLIDTSVDGRLTPERVLAPRAASRATCRSSCAARRDAADASRRSCGSRASRRRQNPPRVLRLALMCGRRGRGHVPRSRTSR